MLSQPMAAFPYHKKSKARSISSIPSPPLKLLLICITEDPPTSQTQIKAFLGEALCPHHQQKELLTTVCGVEFDFE